MCPPVGDIFVLKIISLLVSILFAEIFLGSHSTLVFEIISVYNSVFFCDIKLINERQSF